MQRRIIGLQKKRISGDMINVFILIISAVAILAILGSALGTKFLSVVNFQSMAYQLPEFGFIAIGMSLCMLTGGIDLSLVSIANLATVTGGMVMKNLYENGNSVAASITACFVVALIIATLCGLFNGFLISKMTVYPILATLATNIFYQGITYAMTSGSTVTGFPIEFSDIGLVQIFGVPFGFVLLIIAIIIMALILGNTLFGKKIYLYGESKTVSLFSGIKVDSLIIKVYMLAGFCSGIGGILLMTRVNSAKVGYGDTYILQAILVSVLGGISVNGGKGKLIGVFLGMIVLQLLQSGFTALGILPYYKNFIWGIVLIGVMIANYFIVKRHESM